MGAWEGGGADDEFFGPNKTKMGFKGITLS